MSRTPEGYWGYSALHVAATAGQPEAIKTILCSGKFDSLFEDNKGNTALHLATRFEKPFVASVADFCEIPDIGGLDESEYSSLPEAWRELVRIAENKRQGCVDLLLQAGIDVWDTNNDKKIADPGPNASTEYSAWWYDKLSTKTLETKAGLMAAANAVSVTGALVATASYVGLQPPLGYAAQSEGLIDKMQVGIPSVRVFIVCNTLAFYWALAAIMMSLIPSLPMPQESMLNELESIWSAVILAVLHLILSIVTIFMAFASASIAVIPNDASWNHGGLTVSTLVVGGLTCCLALDMCFTRWVRLSFYRSRSLHRYLVKSRIGYSKPH